MPTDPFRMIDPELIIPSSTSATQIQFWQRMNEWSVDSGARVGPATLRALYELADRPPNLDHLPTGDFWTILSKYSARGFHPSETTRKVCKDHLNASYKSQLGAKSNINMLIDDLQTVDPNRRVALSTVEDCWSDTPLSDC